jgi:fluoroquinolone transport system permease protein
MSLRIIRYDFLQISRDPMLIMSIAAPVLLWLILEFVYPLAADFALSEWDVDILPYFMATSVILMTLIPMLLGMVFGFILLDERDGGLIMAISVTPLGKSGYILLRMGLPVGYSFICLLVFVILLDIAPQLGVGQHVALAFLLSLSAPIMLLFLGAFASNKVEGLAVSKGFGLLLVAVPIGLFAPDPFHWFGAYSPLFWVGKAYFSETFAEFVFYYLPGLLFHIVLLLLLSKKFRKRMD